MPTKITEARIKSIAKKLNVSSTNLTPDEILDTVMDKIEELLLKKWKRCLNMKAHFFDRRSTGASIS